MIKWLYLKNRVQSWRWLTSASRDHLISIVSTSLHFLLLLFFPFPFAFHLTTGLTLPSACFLPSYSCVLLYVCLCSHSLTASFLLFFLSSLSCTLSIPTLHALALSLWHSVLMHTCSFSVLLVCHPPSLLSSLMSLFSKTLSNLSLSSLFLQAWVDYSGVSLWPALKESQLYMYGFL